MDLEFDIILLKYLLEGISFYKKLGIENEKFSQHYILKVQEWM